MFKKKHKHKYTKWFPTPYANGVTMVRVCRACGMVDITNYDIRIRYEELIKVIDKIESESDETE